MSEATDKVLSKLRAPDERGKQRSVGPSELGGCPKCLANRLNQRLTGVFAPSESNLASWTGTQVHYALEKTLGLGVPERKVFIYHLDGYGDISGHIDLTLDNEIIDYKVVGKASFDKMQLAYRRKPEQIPTVGYRSQQMLYAYGVRLLGEAVDRVNLMVFPKHKSSWDDVSVFTEEYNQEVVDKTLERLEYIWKLVQEGKVEDIPSDSDCYNCNMKLRISLRK